MAAGKISKESRIVFVNDGSKDRTWEIIESLHKENPLFQGIKLSRNKGHQNALLAGLMTVKEHCDMAISMDADLQDDIDAIDGMLEKYAEGCDIVYGVMHFQTVCLLENFLILFSEPCLWQLQVISTNIKRPKRVR